MRRSFWFLTVLLSSFLSAGQAFGVTVDRASSGQTPSYINIGTAPTLANAKSLASQPTRPLFSKTVQPSINPDSGSVDAKVRARVHQNYGKLPLRFEINEGQIDEQVKFRTRGSGYSMFFTPTESVLVLSKRSEQHNPSLRGAIATKQSSDSGLLRSARNDVLRDDAGEGDIKSEEKIKSTAIRMRLEGANPTPTMFGEDILPGKSNYFIGSDPKKWRTNISNYKKVRYEEVYPGIDLVYYGNQRRLEYDFIVQPGANPKVIQLSFAGIDSYSVENGGDLVLHTAQGDVIQQKPVIYQEIGGKREKVAGNYIFLDDEKVAFHLGDYDKTQPLVIDPVLLYSTFLAGAQGAENQGGIAVDSSGNAYVTGFTGDGFPTTAGAFNVTHNGGGFDVFVSKLNPAGSTLLYSTFLGGDNSDQGFGIAVDLSGNAYVTGRTFDGTFPTTAGAFDTTHNGSFDVFVIKLNPAGSTLLYSTFLGGGGFDIGFGIAVDSSGNAYVTGQSPDAATDFPTTAGAFAETHNGGGFDVFVSKLNPAGDDLVYSTFLGGNATDQGFGISVDASIATAGITGYGLGDVILPGDDVKDNPIIDKFTVVEFSP